MPLPKRFYRVVHRLLRPVTPKSRRLPLKYWEHSREGGAEPELENLGKLVRGRGAAIDVGANVGLFSYRLAQIFRKVVAFEVNRDLIEDLAAWNPGNIEIITKGLSSSAAELTLHIPVLRGVPLVGWASLAPGNCPDTDEHLTRHVEVITLDSLGLTGISFIKIDVEGHELEVLRGGEKTLAANQPVLLIEIKDRNLAGVRSLLAGLGYRETPLRELAGVEGSPENHIFLPDGK